MPQGGVVGHLFYAIETFATTGTGITKEIGECSHYMIDYNKDLTDSSTINAHFVGETKNYSTTINKNFSSMIIVETGFDLIFEDGWNIKTVFSRIDKNGLGHENNFEIRAVKNN